MNCLRNVPLHISNLASQPDQYSREQGRLILMTNAASQSRLRIRKVKLKNISLQISGLVILPELSIINYTFVNSELNMKIFIISERIRASFPKNISKYFAQNIDLSKARCSSAPPTPAWSVATGRSNF